MYQVGNLLGHAICLVWDIIRFLFKVLQFGTVKICRRNKKMIVVYSILLLSLLISFVSYLPIYLAEPNVAHVHIFNFILFGFVVFIIFCALYEYIKEYPVLKRKKAFQQIFKEIKLYTKDSDDIIIIPKYLNETVTEYLDIISFNSLTPLKVWQEKRELLEMYTNLKIIDITQEPNNVRVINLIVQIRELPDMVQWNDNYINFNQNILCVGKSVNGLIDMNLDMFPHGLIGGETGSGKSNIFKCMIHQSILKGYKTILIDFKRGVSFNQFSDFITVYYEYETIIKALQEMVNETQKRLDLFRECHVDNLKDYNAVSSNKLQRVVIFIDELAELLKTRDKQISNKLTDSLESLLRLSRATGIHVIMGAQRPDSTVISGQIKNNAPFRVCGKFVDGEPSRIMLNSSIANTLPNIKGRFYVKGVSLEEVQCFYFANSPVDYTSYTAPTAQNPPVKEQTDSKAIKHSSKTENSLKGVKFDFSDINKK